MSNDEYVRAIEKALAELEVNLAKRDLINAEIAGLRETVRVLSNRIPLAAEQHQRIAQLFAITDYATPSLIDSIRALLMKVYPTEMTVIEIRNALEDSGFNFDNFSNPLSACHAALKRGHADIHPGHPKEGKPTYKAVPKLTPPPGYMQTMTLLEKLAESLAQPPVNQSERRTRSLIPPTKPVDKRGK